MKRIAIAFCLLCFLLALPVHAQEYDYCAGAASAAAPSCATNDLACTSTAEELFLFGSESGTTWIASKFVATANATICSVVVPLSKNGTGQTVTAYIYSHDGTWDEPETLVGTGRLVQVVA